MKPNFLKTIYVIIKKELMIYFNSPIAYIFIAVFLITGNWLFFKNFFLMEVLDMRSYFMLLPWLFMFLAPAITMRLWSEEKKSGTLELLLTLPASSGQIVLGKFFSAWIFLAINLILSLSVPLSLNTLGSLDAGVVTASYLGAWLLGGVYLALGLVASAMTKNQIIAFIVGAAASFLLFLIGQSYVTNSLPQSLGMIAQYIGLGYHFESISRGVLDSRDLFYYLSFTAFFLWLNVKVLEARQWK